MREKVVSKAFDYIKTLCSAEDDEIKDGEVSVEKIRELHNCDWQPEVKAGKVRFDDMRDVFVSMLDSTLIGPRTGYIGRTKWVDGSSYDGAHADGRPHGEGTCTYSDGGWYEGGWARGLRHGDGVMGYADGSRWEGQWREGRRHGRGVRVAPSGERHEEEWSHGERQLWAPPKPKGYAAEPPQRKVRISVTTGQTAADGGVDDAARGV